MEAGHSVWRRRRFIDKAEIKEVRSSPCREEEDYLQSPRAFQWRQVAARPRPCTRCPYQRFTNVYSPLCRLSQPLSNAP
jgi:hypothetical protein